MPFRPLIFDPTSGEIKQLPGGERIAFNALMYSVIYPEPTTEWVIEHNKGEMLPIIPYFMQTPTGIAMAGVDESRSDTMRTILHLTQPMSGVLIYWLLD